MDLRAQFNNLKDFLSPNMISVNLKNLNLQNWNVIISGPKQTPYYGYKFSLNITFPSDFPTSRPTVTMETPIFHPNIGSSGNICIDIFSSWKNTNSMRYVILAIIGLLSDPNPNSCLNSEAGNLYKNNNQEYCNRAISLARERATPVSAT